MFKAKRSAQQTQQTVRGVSVLTQQQKALMTRAFWFYKQDRQARGNSACVDITEWKCARAFGDASPMLKSYLKLAGWERSWPWPKPEGRLLRREGQEAAIARYSR